MAAIKKRLDELVADAERQLRPDEVVFIPAVDWQAQAEQFVRDVAREAVVAASRGDYRRACKLAELNETYLPFLPGDLRNQDILGPDLGIPAAPNWVSFREACELAERIDSFLAAVGRGAQGAGLAADCRECLDMLLVLADWCGDQGRPAAAAEARRLHALASSLP